MAIALVTGCHAAKVSSNTTSATTTGIATTGANCFVVMRASVPIGNVNQNQITDNQSNVFVPLTIYAVSPTQAIQFWLCLSPTTAGSGHTFTVSGTSATYPSIFMAGFSGVNTVCAVDQINGLYTPSVTSIQAGSITPSANNELVVAGLSYAGTTTISINGSFTITDQLATSAGNAVGGALAYWIQTTAAAANPTWSWSGSQNAAAEIMSIAPTQGGGGSTYVPQVGVIQSNTWAYVEKRRRRWFDMFLPQRRPQLITEAPIMFR